MQEAGVPPIPLQVWAALFVPAGAPDAVVTRLNRELIHVIRGEGRTMLEREGMVIQEMTPAQLATHVKSQLDIWGRAIREAGIPRD
jgi:tripartite-type tricarboxylate transporter receptor subunit TctC